MDIFSLKDKTVILTGGCGHLGRVMARSLLDYGAELVIADVTDQAPDELMEDVRAGKLHVLKCDLSKTESIRDMYQRAYDLCGHLDVLVTNAAYGGGATGGGPTPHKIEEVTDEIWERGIDGTVHITFRCIREIIPFFDKNPGGAIVTIASMYGMICPDFSMYGSSGQASPPFYGTGKAGVLQLTRYCAGQLAEKGIRVNSITPGPFPRITPAMDQVFLKKLQNKTMLKHTGDAADLSGALLLLASDASRFMTGSNIVVDGGMTAM